MRRPLSLALRLTLLFGIAAAIVFPIFGWVIFQSTENHFKAEDSEELEIISAAVRQLLSGTQSADELYLLEQRFDDLLVGHHDASLRIAAQDGEVVYSSPGPDLSAIAQTHAAEIKGGGAILLWNNAGHSYRVSIRSAAAGDNGLYAITVAVPIDHHLRFFASFRRSLWLMIAGSIVIMSLMGWIAARQGHAPLHDIVARIHRISANELNTRLSPEAVPGELTELAVSFNGMLERVDEAFHRLSDFNADIAHELRTPIANLMTQTQVALSRARTIDEYREILYSNMEEYESMAQMVGDMLFLAQADNHQHLESVAQLDLAAEVRALFDFYEGWAEERGVALAQLGSATTMGNRQMLQRALSNILSNAIRHAPAGGTVRVELSTSKTGETSIVVENPGEAIPPEHLPRLFDRFYRVDASRHKSDKGIGLGLAIAASIVKTHDGRIDVVSGDGHTRFTITLPPRTTRLPGSGQLASPMTPPPSQPDVP